MKTFIQNNKKLIRYTVICSISALTALIGINVYATVKAENQIIADAKIEMSAEALMTQDLIQAIYEVPMDEQIAETLDENTVEVYDENDQIVFSGALGLWENNNHAETIALKRKAELLFTTDGTQVYKVFNMNDLEVSTPNEKN